MAHCAVGQGCFYSHISGIFRKFARKIKTLLMNTDNKQRLLWMSVGIIVVTIVLDQIIKIAVKTNMYYGESIRITV